MTFYLLHWLLATLAVMFTAYVVPGMKVDSFLAALFASLMIGFVNILVWPLLVLLTLPLTIVTFGLFLFVVNGIALKIAAAISPGFSIEGFLPAILGSIVLSIVGWLARYVLFNPNTLN